MLRKLFFVAIFASILTAWPVLAQEVSAGVTGLVTDPSGSVVANASVSMKDRDRGTDWSAKTNNDGIYNFPRGFWCKFRV